MNKQKIILIVSGAVLAVLVAGGVAFLVKESATASADKSSRDGALKKLERFYDAEPFPAPTNVVILKGLTGQVEEHSDALLAALSAGRIPRSDESATPAGFKQRLEFEVLALRDQAPIVDGTRVIAGTFNFGFDRYLGVAGMMPEEENVGRLSQQLATIKEFAQMIYAARLSEWKSVEREAFDVGSEEAAEEEEAPRGRRGRRRQTLGETGASGRPGVGAMECDLEGCELLEAYTLQVAGRQLALFDLLNRIAASPTCMVVSDVSLARRSPSIRKYVAPDAKAAAPAGRGGRARAAEPAEGAAKPEPDFIPQSERIVSGPEVDAIVEARIVVEVYHFAEPEPVAEPASRAVGAEESKPAAATTADDSKGE